MRVLRSEVERNMEDIQTAKGSVTVEQYLYDRDDISRFDND